MAEGRFKNSLIVWKIDTTLCDILSVLGCRDTFMIYWQTSLATALRFLEIVLLRARFTVSAISDARPESLVSRVIMYLLKNKNVDK